VAHKMSYQLATKHFQLLSAKDTTQGQVAVLAEMMSGLKVGLEYVPKIGVWRVGVRAYDAHKQIPRMAFANTTLGYQAGIAVAEETALYPALKKSMLSQVLSAAHVAFKDLLKDGPVTYFFSEVADAPEVKTETVTQAPAVLIDVDMSGVQGGPMLHAKMSKAFAELMAKKLDDQFKYDMNELLDAGKGTKEEDKQPHPMFVPKVKAGPAKKKKAPASKKETVQSSQGGHMNMIAEMVAKTPVNLRDATALYQPVHGTSPGSVYHVVGITTEGVKVAARYKGSAGHGLSIRVDGPDMKQYQSLLKEIGLGVPSDGESATHWSMHVTVEQPWLASRTVGSILGHLARKLNFTTPVPQFEEVYKHGC
jgi:hypothetical protein